MLVCVGGGGLGRGCVAGDLHLCFTPCDHGSLR